MKIAARLTRLEGLASGTPRGLQLHFHQPGQTCLQCAELEQLPPAIQETIRIHAVTFVLAVRPG